MWLKRQGIATDKQLTINYPTTLTTQVLGIYDCGLRTKADGSNVVSSAMVIVGSETLSSCIMLQDSHTDQGGYVLIIGI